MGKTIFFIFSALIFMNTCNHKKSLDKKRQMDFFFKVLKYAQNNEVNKIEGYYLGGKSQIIKKEINDLSHIVNKYGLPSKEELSYDSTAYGQSWVPRIYAKYGKKKGDGRV